MAITSIKTGSSFTNLIKYNDFLAGNSAYIPPSFESIATVTASGGETSLTFNSIPSTYASLQIRGIARDTATFGIGDVGLKFRFNSDSGNNYGRHQLYGDGTTAGAVGSASTNAIIGYFGSTASGGSNTTIYGVSIIDILDYASTTKYKTARMISGSSANLSNTEHGVQLSSGVWMSTSAITSITMVANYTAYAAGTTFALYGIK